MKKGIRVLPLVVALALFSTGIHAVETDPDIIILGEGDYDLSDYPDGGEETGELEDLYDEYAPEDETEAEDDDADEEEDAEDSGDGDIEILSDTDSAPDDDDLTGYTENRHNVQDDVKIVWGDYASDDDDDDDDDGDDEDEDETENRDPEAIERVIVVNIMDAPEANRKPEYTAEVSRGNAVVSYEGWKCSDGRVNYSTSAAYGINDRRFSTFEEGKTYTYCIVIAAKGEDFFTGGTSFTVRGVSAYGTFNADMTMCMFDNLFTSSPVCSHEYQTVRVKATCTTNGREYRKCSLCGKEEQIRDIPALGHAYELDDEGCSEATCARAGMEMYRCTREDCGNVYVKTLPALGHAYVVNVIKTATDSREGTYNMVCANEDCEASTNKHTIFPYKSIKLPKSKYSCTGSAIKPDITVTDTLGRAINPRYYEVVYLHNKNVGTATVHVTFSGMYSGKMTKTFKIVKGTQKISYKAATFTVPKNDVKKHSYKFHLGVKGKTSLSYKTSSKKITVDKKGFVTVKKGTKKGTYTVTVTAKGTKNWKKATKKIKIKVK